jgi:hypothetical protein
MPRQHKKSETEGNVEATVAESNGSSVVPIIVDAGSRSKSSIRRLKKGTGRLMREVNEVVHEVRATSSAAAGGVVPIVIVYREKLTRGTRIPSPLDLFR